MLSNVEALSRRVAQGSVQDGAEGRTSVAQKWPYAADCVVALAQGVVDVCWEVQRASAGALVHAAKHQMLRAKVVTVCERYAPGSFPTPDGLLTFLASLADDAVALPRPESGPTEGWDVGASTAGGTVQESRAAVSRTLDQYNARAPAMGTLNPAP